MRNAATYVLLLAGALAAQDRPAASQAPDARRDPFVDPFRRSGPPPETARPRGLAGIAVGELTLRGLVSIDGAYVAVLESDNGSSHLLRGGELLFDGSVGSVSAGGVVIVRDGQDAVHLMLRPAHEER